MTLLDGLGPTAPPRGGGGERCWVAAGRVYVGPAPSAGMAMTRISSTNSARVTFSSSTARIRRSLLVERAESTVTVGAAGVAREVRARVVALGPLHPGPV